MRGVRCAVAASPVWWKPGQSRLGRHVPDAVLAASCARPGCRGWRHTQCLQPCALCLRRRQVVIAPHIYCAGVSNSPLATSGQDLYSKLDTTFGYLTATGALRLGCVWLCPLLCLRVVQAGLEVADTP